MYGTLKEVNIVHESTREKKTLDVLRITNKTIDLRWPLRGAIEFSTRTGKGLKKLSMWSICPENLKVIHKDLGIQNVTMGPREEPDDA